VVLAWMPVPFFQGWQHDEFQVNTELSNSGVECLKAGQGRFAFDDLRFKHTEFTWWLAWMLTTNARDGF